MMDNLEMLKFTADSKSKEFFAKWLEFLRFQKNYSDHTIINYETDLSYFFKFINQHFEEEITSTLLQKIKISDVRSWLAKRKSEGFEFSSTARTISAIRNFYKFLDKNYGLVNQALFNIRKPKLKKFLPKSLNEEDAREALKGILDIEEEPWVSKRDMAILTLIYGAGLRISEAMSVKQEDFSSNTIRVLGKGNKERLVPILPIISTRIQEYLTSCPYNIEDGMPIFVGKRGAPFSPSSFQKQIKKLRRSIGLPESTTPHSFRHSFATHLLQDGADLRSIQELLGHKSLSSTQRYTKIDVERLQSVYNSAHPRG